MSSLILPRISLAESIKQAEISPYPLTTDIELSEDHVAPFDGILVPPAVYRYYRKQDELAERLERELNDNFATRYEPTVDQKILYLCIGILVGGASYYFLFPSK